MYIAVNVNSCKLNLRYFVISFYTKIEARTRAWKWLCHSPAVIADFNLFFPNLIANKSAHLVAFCYNHAR